MEHLSLQKLNPLEMNGHMITPKNDIYIFVFFPFVVSFLFYLFIFYNLGISLFFLASNNFTKLQANLAFWSFVCERSKRLPGSKNGWKLKRLKSNLICYLHLLGGRSSSSEDLVP